MFFFELMNKVCIDYKKNKKKINVIQRAKLHTPDISSGENTRSRLAEHASSTFDATFRWFLYFVSKNNEFFQILWNSTV